MMIVTNDKVDRLKRAKDRHTRFAHNDFDTAKQLFCVGSCDFAEPLETACKHYGAAQEIEKTLKVIGYNGDHGYYTEHDMEMIKLGIIQKLMGLALILISIVSILPENDATGALVFIPLGLYVIFTKKCLIRAR